MRLDAGRAVAIDPLSLFRLELSERLVVHWTGGAWRVPLSNRMAEVRAADGVRLGRIVCAGGADVDRALAGLRAGPAPEARELQAALSPSLPLLTRLRALEAAADPADAPVSAILAQLAALARAGGVWVPAPQRAASAHLILRTLSPLLGARVALLQGDQASRDALAQRLSPATGPSRR